MQPATVNLCSSRHIVCTHCHTMNTQDAFNPAVLSKGVVRSLVCFKSREAAAASRLPEGVTTSFADCQKAALASLQSLALYCFSTSPLSVENSDELGCCLNLACTASDSACCINLAELLTEINLCNRCRDRIQSTDPSRG